MPPASTNQLTLKMSRYQEHKAAIAPMVDWTYKRIKSTRYLRPCAKTAHESSASLLFSFLRWGGVWPLEAHFSGCAHLGRDGLRQRIRGGAFWSAYEPLGRAAELSDDFGRAHTVVLTTPAQRYFSGSPAAAIRLTIRSEALRYTGLVFLVGAGTLSVVEPGLSSRALVIVARASATRPNC